MSTHPKLAQLRQMLERWKSHNEVHAKPADNVLYEFLSEFLKLADYDDESGSPEEIPTVPPEGLPIHAEAIPEDNANDDPPAGGNSPEGTPDLP